MTDLVRFHDQLVTPADAEALARDLILYGNAYAVPTDRRLAGERVYERVDPREVKIATPWASCGWVGKRMSDRLGEQSAPCPRCGKAVVR